MKNKITVTVGIPAYNEEANISKLLKSILAQKELDYKLEKIIIVCDASTDKTYKIIKSFKDSRILHLKNPERCGQQFSQNIILKNSKSEVTLILEGDIILADKRTINRLIKPFLKNRDRIGMVIGKSKPVEAEGFYEKILNYGHEFRSGLFSKWKQGINVYCGGGHSMKALSKQFAKKLTWPKQVPEDAYTYLKLKQKGFGMVRIPTAIAYMRNPANLKDRIKQVNKFQNGRKVLEKHFPEEFVRNEYAIPYKLSIIYTLKEFFKNPAFLTLYLLEIIVNRTLTFSRKEFDALYEPYESSKQLKLI